MSLTAEAKAFRSKEIDRTCKMFDLMDVEVAKQDPALRKKLLEEWTEERDSIIMGLRIDPAYIIVSILWAALAIVCVTFVANWLRGYLDGLKWIGYVGGVIFCVPLIRTIRDAISEAKDQRDVNEEYYERMDEKIRELSKK